MSTSTYPDDGTSGIYVRNTGNTTLYVSRMISWGLINTEYDHTGWYEIEPGKTREIYFTLYNHEVVHLGFAYRDLNGNFGSMKAVPGWGWVYESKWVIPVQEKNWNYSGMSKTELLRDVPGWVDMEYSCVVQIQDNTDYTLKIKPDKNNLVKPLFGRGGIKLEAVNIPRSVQTVYRGSGGKLPPDGHTPVMTLIDLARSGKPIDQTNAAIGMLRSASVSGDPNSPGNQKHQRVRTAAVKLLELAADSGDPVAMDTLGWAYDNGWGVEQDPDKAYELFRQAAEAGNTHALTNQGAMMIAGRGVNSDPKTGITLLDKAAKQGDGNAMYYAGWMRFWGKGIGKDIDRGLAQLKQAVDQGNLNAMLLMVDICENGLQGVKKSQSAAHSWRKPAAAHGHAESAYRLGYAYMQGRTLKRDNELAAKYYRIAAEKRHPEAMAQLAQCYSAGRGVERDREAAFEWRKRAAEAGDVDSYWIMGHAYEFGQGVKTDQEAAFRWYLRSAENGVTIGIPKVAERYFEGKGVEKNGEEAFRWASHKSMANNYKAMGIRGYCYLTGFGTHKNMSKGISLLEKAAERRDPNASYQLGMCYINGVGVIRNEEKGIALLKQAPFHEDARAYLKKVNAK